MFKIFRQGLNGLIICCILVNSGSLRLDFAAENMDALCQALSAQPLMICYNMLSTLPIKIVGSIFNEARSSTSHGLPLSQGQGATRPSDCHMVSFETGKNILKTHSGHFPFLPGISGVRSCPEPAGTPGNIPAYASIGSVFLLFLLLFIVLLRRSSLPGEYALLQLNSRTQSVIPDWVFFIYY